jgi:hypothetical protein
MASTGPSGGGGVPRWAIIAAAAALVVLVAVWIFGDPLRREAPPAGGDQAIDEVGPTAEPEADPLQPPVGDRRIENGAPDVPGQAREPDTLETEPVPTGPRVEDPFLVRSRRPSPRYSAVGPSSLFRLSLAN